MKVALAAILLLSLLFSQRYELAWESSVPLDPSSIRATVTGGSLVAIFTVSDGTRGWIQATAERACLTIEMEGRTIGGAPVRIIRSWNSECERYYLPFFPMGEHLVTKRRP